MSESEIRLDEHRIIDEPYYEATGHEVQIAEAVYHQGLPLLLKGPTGCGKTRFMQYMAWRVSLQNLNDVVLPY